MATFLLILFGFMFFLYGKNNPTEETFVAKHGPKPIFNESNHSYLEVVQYLQEMAVDPDSIQLESCAKMKQTDKGWFVRCKYLGKNKHGEFSQASKGFYISNRRVILTQK